MCRKPNRGRKHLSEDVKWKIVTDLLEGKTYRECARVYQVALSTVIAAMKRFRAEKNFKRKKGSGRPRKTTAREDRLLHVAARRNREAHAEILCEKVGVKVSRWTVEQRLDERDGMSWRGKTKKPLISAANKKARLKWAREHKNWSLKQWFQVLWSDEAPFSLQSKVKQYFWGRDHEKLQPFAIQPTVKHPKKINVWGCFSARGVGVLHRIEGTMTK